MPFPTVLALWTALGGLTAYRTLVRPCRALIEEGSVTSCPGGPGCSSSLTVTSDRGTSGIYALATGVVTRVTLSTVEIASSREPVVLLYSGPDLRPTVSAGAPVKIGQNIALASTVSLSVSMLQRFAGGTIGAVPLEVATWLASRGLKAAMRLSPSSLWCAQGRHLVIPQEVGQCGLRLPDPSGFSLLPVSARLQ